MRTNTSDAKKEVLQMHSEIEHLTGRAKKVQIEKTEQAAKKLLREPQTRR